MAVVVEHEGHAGAGRDALGAQGGGQLDSSRSEPAICHDAEPIGQGGGVAPSQRGTQNLAGGGETVPARDVPEHAN